MGYPRTAVRGPATLTAVLLMGACVPPVVGSDDPPPPPVGAGTLTEDQVRGALPQAEQAPEGFQIDAEEHDNASEPGDEATAYPASCLDIRLAGTAGKALRSHRKARLKRTFAGDDGGSLTVSIASHDQAVPAQLFDDAGAAQSSCGSFQLIDETGTSSWKLSRIAFPQIGDRTYSARVESTTEGDIFRGGVVQIAGASRGNNLVYVVYASGPQSAYDPDAVETFTTSTISNLDAL